MVDWTKPGLTDTYANFLSYLAARDVDAATQFVGSSSTNIPTGAMRWSPTNYRWETYNGSTWAAWSTNLAVATVTLGGNPTSALQAAPKQYVDSAVAACQPAGAYLTANQNITLSGDAIGSGTTAIAVTLAASGVAAGSYSKVTVNAKGLVTGGAAIASLDVTTALGYTPANATTAAFLGVAQTFTKSQAATIQAITYGATITLDLTQGNDAAVTLTGNATLANPSAMTPGSSGHIVINQDTTGGRTLAYGSYWKFGSNGTPTLSTAASAKDVLVYWVADSTHIIASIVQAVQ